MDGKLVGFSLFCFVYYTWVGKSIYLDDLYVKLEARGRGIGTRLMKVKESTPNHCCWTFFYRMVLNCVKMKDNIKRDGIVKKGRGCFELKFVVLLLF